MTEEQKIAPATVPTGCEAHTPFDIDCRVCRAYWPELVEAHLKADREKIAALEANSCITCDWMPLKAENAKRREKIAALDAEVAALREKVKATRKARIDTSKNCGCIYRYEATSRIYWCGECSKKAGRI